MAALTDDKANPILEHLPFVQSASNRSLNNSSIGFGKSLFGGDVTEFRFSCNGHFYIDSIGVRVKALLQYAIHLVS